MMFLLITMSILYLIFILVMLAAWYATPKVGLLKEMEVFPRISIIIPVRNEEMHIKKLLSQIIAQQYPSTRFEVIVVNDHSTDNTASLVEQMKNKDNIDLRLINLKDTKKGKKAALSEGIRQAKGEIMVTTDGDCEMDPEWLKTIVSPFDKGVKMVFGPVAIKANTFFEKMQMIDFAALIGVGAGTWKIGFSGMCNGANLAFRKDVFEECSGYEGTEQYPSGDDEFLLRKIYKRYPQGIRFIKSKAAVVFTKAQPDFGSFIQQRTRWAGKWKLHPDITTKLTALFIFFFYTLMLIVTGWTFYMHENVNTVLSIWVLKWLLDAALVSNVLKLSNQRLPIIESLILSVTYPFYAISIGISTINYTFEWKGRYY